MIIQGSFQFHFFFLFVLAFHPTSLVSISIIAPPFFSS